MSNHKSLQQKANSRGKKNKINRRREKLNNWQLRELILKLKLQYNVSNLLLTSSEKDSTKANKDIS